MKLEGGKILLSASDLMRFMGCQHATAMDLRYARGEPLVPAEDSEDAQLLQKYGDQHEASYLAKLRNDGQQVLEFNRDIALPVAAELTREKLFDGAGVIFQGAFFDAPWGGWSDFLIRVERPSLLGPFSYEVIDTKLKRKPDPKHILQLVLYSDLLARLQGTEPEQAHLELGNGERFSFHLNEYAAYARHARERLEGFVADAPDTSPDPVRMCNLCRWREHCKAHWGETDSLALVAGISRTQRDKLTAAGVTTMTALGQFDKRVPKLADDTLARLKIQARLQTDRRAGGPPAFELKVFDSQRGLALLPRPDRGDLFYDIEGDPFYEGGLEYLHGLWFEDDGTGVFKDFWGHDRAEEKEALRQLMAFFEVRLRRYPSAHIYHYADYEVAALRRLTGIHGIGESLLDQMLRECRFVDLYRVVSGGIIVSEPRYSLKNLEVFYMEERTGEVKTAGGSVVAYEGWRESGDQHILDEIRDYNRIDCISTQKLRDWLIAAVRPADMPWRAEKVIADEKVFDLEKVNVEQSSADELRDRLTPVRQQFGDSFADLLFDLSYFHRRERKPAWWSVFDKMGREPERLVDDLDCLGALEATSSAKSNGNHWVRTYRFPEQESKLQSGDCHIELNGAPAPASAEIDLAQNTAEVRFPKKWFDGAPAAISLVPPGPLRTDAIEGAVDRVVDSIIRYDRQYPAILDLLHRSKPRFRAGNRTASIVNPDRDLVQEAVAAIVDMDGTTLVIQGPPGTGKTYVSSRAILDLVGRGKRIAVASNSHKAIDNLLFAVADGAAELKRPVSIAKKNGHAGDEGYNRSIYVATSNNDRQLFSASVVGGTAWLLARPDFEQTFDYLFVDEAGQVSLANLIAMGTCAKNIVLVGDPMQLPQPVQGAHPDESGLSALEYRLAGHNTVPPDVGIFLPVTRRLHPDLCRFISDTVYDGRLRSNEHAARQAIVVEEPASGVRLCEIVHTGNRQTSPEEIEAINHEMSRLVGNVFRDRDGRQRRITLDDLLVVAPYNAQVNALKRVLPAGARVGTVDKFQGQEAPVCLISMTSSSYEEIPRGVDFLFSLNRINVAVSRAQVLALVFASPKLLDIPCSNIHEMRLVNTLCALRQYGRAQSELQTKTAWHTA
ncbi:TM0106 family RecB-like putative nuclease [Mesorhizobium sp. CA15]|uniref:TM0106 family RecB-like putative nuclease n=1 Tax=Mesorhizobium sp. CA15 TaxID=2876641 RepID=UPI001CD16049|nr:TM0106 family RecB-like putative nuclease [Mesorhizobium sp. CA15]MBZ9864218.1 TM0106 family RecB-like putative nuclease [Mesorhizobium sp. CA15]